MRNIHNIRAKKQHSNIFTTQPTTILDSLGRQSGGVDLQPGQIKFVNSPDLMKTSLFKDCFSFARDN